MRPARHRDVLGCSVEETSIWTLCVAVCVYVWLVSEWGAKWREEVMHVNTTESQGGQKEGRDRGADAGKRQ